MHEASKLNVCASAHIRKFELGASAGIDCNPRVVASLVCLLAKSKAPTIGLPVYIPSLG